jgi:hypothetical protein
MIHEFEGHAPMPATSQPPLSSSPPESPIHADFMLPHGPSDHVLKRTGARVVDRASLSPFFARPRRAS